MMEQEKLLDKKGSGGAAKDVPEKCPRCGSMSLLEEAKGRYVCCYCNYCFGRDGKEIKGGLWHGKK